MAQVKTDGECLEQCEGLILNLMETSQERQDKEQYSHLFHLYEHYKSPNVTDFSYFKKDINDENIYDLRGNIWTDVLISKSRK